MRKNIILTDNPSPPSAERESTKSISSAACRLPFYNKGAIGRGAFFVDPDASHRPPLGRVRPASLRAFSEMTQTSYSFISSFVSSFSLPCARSFASPVQGEVALRSNDGRVVNTIPQALCASSLYTREPSKSVTSFQASSVQGEAKHAFMCSSRSRELLLLVCARNKVWCENERTRQGHSYLAYLINCC